MHHHMISASLKVISWEISGNFLRNFSVLGSGSVLNYTDTPP